MGFSFSPWLPWISGHNQDGEQKGAPEEGAGEQVVGGQPRPGQLQVSLLDPFPSRALSVYRGGGQGRAVSETPSSFL